MARNSNDLYRRNGQFYARLRVPKPWKVYMAGLAFEHLSIQPITGKRGLASWKCDFLPPRSMLGTHQAAVGSALLLGDGLITIESVARDCGLHVEDVLREVINRGEEVRIEAEGWHGTDVPANELETGYDSAMLPDDMLTNRDRHEILGTLYARSDALALARRGQLTDCVFFQGCVAGEQL